MGAVAERKQRGAWYTPDDLVATIVAAVVTEQFVQAAAGRRLRIVDPACGDGRFLRAVADRVVGLGGRVHLVGVDIDDDAAAATRRNLRDAAGGPEDAVTFDVVAGDALGASWPVPIDATARESAGAADPGYDLVIGNPPFLSQMAAATTRGGASRRGGGPYADAAVEFLALAAELVADHPADQGRAAGPHGRVAFVLPQSLLSARDARPVRELYDRRASLIWSWWTGARVFDAQVLTCALAFEFDAPAPAPVSVRAVADTSWSRVVTSRSGIPDVPAAMAAQCCGVLGDRARLNANFRDEYYGMIPAVGDHDDGPRLITSGLIDPGTCLWGVRPVTFAKRSFERPRLDLGRLDGKMRRWAHDRLVPKVLIANQTKIIEAIVDPDGSTLPGVPVVAAYPVTTGADASRSAWEISAVLTSPVASAWAWHRHGGTGLSADAIRLGPVMLAALPWPAGALDGAVAALRRGDVRSCALAVHAAYGLDDAEAAALTGWWVPTLDRIEARRRR